MENVHGLWKCKVGGMEFDLEGEPSYTRAQTISTNVVDSSGRAVAKKQQVNPPKASFTVILTKGKNDAALINKLQSDSVVEFSCDSNGESFTLYNARLSAAISTTGHTAQVSVEGSASA